MGYSINDKKVIEIANLFRNILNESNRKRNKIFVHKGSLFFNSDIKMMI